MSCLSPIDGGGLPFFEKYLKPPEKKNVICIPLCDGVHFQCYIVNIKELKIIHIDSLPWDHPKNPTSLQIAKILFENSNPTFESLFSERKQFDANSCGIWLVTEMSSYLINLPEISDRYNAFDIAYNLLARNPIMRKVESLSSQFFTEDQMKKIASADFVIHVLTNDPERFEYFRQSPSKGIRTNFFFITDISKISISDINADDNGVYLKSCNTSKFYYCDKNRTSIAREDIGGKFYYNERLTRNCYKKVYIPSDKIVKLSRTYKKAKSFARTFIQVSNLASSPPSLFVAVLYQASAIAEKDDVSCHGNATQNSKPYFRTSKDVLQKTREKCVTGLNGKTVYDKINKESGGVYYWSSHSSELRDMRQVHRLKEKTKGKVTKGISALGFSGELSMAIMQQRSDPEFIKTISCISDSYYIFLGTTSQLDDVVKMCCDSDNVLCIDTTFSLCSSWVTDCCYNNDRLRTNGVKHPIFLDPAIVHFEKDVFLFSCFASEMLTYQPAISNLKTIRTDLEKAIFNSFLPQIKDLKLLLWVFHLQQNDKRKLTELKPKDGSQAINAILADIYGRQYSTMVEYGLEDSKDTNDLTARLESLRESWENVCPGFHEWFVSKRKAVFQNSVIECARKNTNVICCSQEMTT